MAVRITVYKSAMAAHNIIEMETFKIQDVSGKIVPENGCKILQSYESNSTDRLPGDETASSHHHNKQQVVVCMNYSSNDNYSRDGETDHVVAVDSVDQEQQQSASFEWSHKSSSYTSSSSSSSTSAKSDNKNQVQDLDSILDPSKLNFDQIHFGQTPEDTSLWSQHRHRGVSHRQHHRRTHNDYQDNYYSIDYVDRQAAEHQEHSISDDEENRYNDQDNASKSYQSEESYAAYSSITNSMNSNNNSDNNFESDFFHDLTQTTEKTEIEKGIVLSSTDIDSPFSLSQRLSSSLFNFGTTQALGKQDRANKQPKARHLHLIKPPILSDVSIDQRSSGTSPRVLDSEQVTDLRTSAIDVNHREQFDEPVVEPPLSTVRSLSMDKVPNDGGKQKLNLEKRDVATKTKHKLRKKLRKKLGKKIKKVKKKLHKKAHDVAHKKEDELTSVNVKQGFSPSLISINLDEFGTARNANIAAFGVYFSALLSEKQKINTLQDINKKKQLINSQGVWLVHSKALAPVENWFRDLANGTKPLGQLGKRIPIFGSGSNQKDWMFCQFYGNVSEYQVPISKAVWYIKMSAAHGAATESSSKSKKSRQTPDQYQEITHALCRYLGGLYHKMSECFQSSSNSSASSSSTIVCRQQQLSTTGNYLRTSSPPSHNQTSARTGKSTLESNIKETKSICGNLSQCPPYPIRSITGTSTFASSFLSHTTAPINSASLLSSQSASTTALSNTSISVSSENFHVTYNQWQYQIQLARACFDEGLLDQHEFLTWLVELFERHIAPGKYVTELNLKVLLPFVLQYVNDFTKSIALSRRLTQSCSEKLATLMKEEDQVTRKESELQTNDAPKSTNNLTNSSNRDDVSSNSFSPSAAVVCIDCPTALVRYRVLGSKGSPLDALPCPPSSLPMTVSDLNPELKEAIREAEVKIFHRSAWADAKWSCQAQNEGISVGEIITWLLDVIDVLDRHNFDRVDSPNCIDSLYSKIFSDKTIGIRDEFIVKLLCEWSITTNRTGEHRAFVTAKLLERRMNDLQGEETNLEQTNQTDASDTKQQALLEQSLNFQDLFIEFLDNAAPILSENDDDPENRWVFSNFVLLFSELIRCEVFSHYSYMCTLVSRGMFNNWQNTASNNGKSVGGGPDRSQPLLGLLPGLSSSSTGPLSVSSITNPLSGFPGSVDQKDVRSPSMTPSLGFSPIPSQQTVSDQPMNHWDNSHNDDVDADLGKILQDIKEGQQEGSEQADILLSDPLGSSNISGLVQADNHDKMNTSNPFNLNPHASRAPPPPPVKPAQNHPTAPTGVIGQQNQQPAPKDGLSPLERRHMLYAKHFPIPTDETFSHDNTQRHILLYGFGKERDDARHASKRLNKEINKLFQRKSCRNINDGGRIKKHAFKEGFSTASVISKFEQHSYYDQHVITNNVSSLVTEMLSMVASGQSNHLPSLESLTFLFELMLASTNISGLIDLVMQILKELPDIDSQLKQKCPNLAGNYCSSVALNAIGILTRHHSCVLLNAESVIVGMFESLLKLVVHITHPNICASSAERVILCYMYDFYSSCSFLQSRCQEQFGLMFTKIKQALMMPQSPSQSSGDLEWTPTFLQEIASPVSQLSPASAGTNYEMNSIKQLQSPESTIAMQLNESPRFRFSFVCDTIYIIASSTVPEIVNDVAILCTELTSRCPLLCSEWLAIF
ncbi:Mediator of RNA polymerase II transcription subunit 12, partial [Fragariocoptes setiger]